MSVLPSISCQLTTTPASSLVYTSSKLTCLLLCQETESATTHELAKGCEWRFEVGFGENVEVKVSIYHTSLLTFPLIYNIEAKPASHSFSLALQKYTALRYPSVINLPSVASKQQYIPGMGACSSVGADLLSSTPLKKPP